MSKLSLVSFVDAADTKCSAKRPTLEFTAHVAGVSPLLLTIHCRVFKATPAFGLFLHLSNKI